MHVPAMHNTPDGNKYGDIRGRLQSLFLAGLSAVDPAATMRLYLPDAPPDRLFIAAIGKAAAPMAKAAAARYGDAASGIVVAPQGYAPEERDLPSTFHIMTSGHPVPDNNSVAAANALIDHALRLGSDDLLLALISGGGSALLAAPVTGVSLSDKRALTKTLLRCGASIAEINCVRKHLSRIKGGRIAALAAPASVVTLAVSDVPGDNIADIASGPTIPDPTTLADARDVLAKYEIAAPQPIARALTDSVNETPKPDNDGAARNRAHVIASADVAIRAAADEARTLDYNPVHLGDDLEGDAVALGRKHAALAFDYAKRGGKWALISGGETTVKVRNPNGRGGRNTTYLLALTVALGDSAGIAAIACDSDGKDGTENNAGAVITPDTLSRAAAADVDAAACLENNNAYEFFHALGDLVVTGPTNTNVNDFRAILIG